MDTKPEAILLLAAGASRRMGQPKQLLTYAGQPVIRHLLNLLCRQGRQVYVVLGAAAPQIRPLISDLPVEIVLNTDWQRGMGSSLRLGMQTILAREAAPAGLLCCVVDQVYLSQAVLDQFWQLSPTSQLVAARYASGVLGVPAFFGEAYFAELAAVADGQGARSLLKRYARQLTVVPFAKGDFDLDYPRDWAAFLRQRRPKRTAEEE